VVKLARNLPMIVAVAGVFFLAVSAQAQKAGSLVDRFERTYRSSRTLQARFLERYLENGKEVRSEAGIAYFERPGRMRWEYQSPEQNLFVIDGKWSWFYVPSDRTVTRVRAKESSDWRTPLALLELRESDPKASSRAASPEGAQGTDGRSVLFELNATTGELRRILVSDPGGVQVEFRFADWLFNPPLDAAMFHFAPPKGVAVVDGDLAAAGASGTASGLSPLGVN
jgi:outer membrane lipoprotein carrier protein